MSQGRRPKPEDRELEKKREELAAIEPQVAERELQLATLRAGLLSFQKRYESAVTERYAELDELRAKIAEAESHHPSPAAEPASPKPEAPRDRRGNGSPSRPRPQAIKTKKADPPPQFNPTEVLKRLYRDVAKIMHPDFADGDTERAHRHAFMVRANEAYESGSEQQLLKVLHEWESSPEAVKGEGSAAELIRTIRMISRCEDRLVAISEEIAKLQGSGFFGLKTMAEEAETLEHDLLSEMTERLDNEIAAARERLSQIAPQINGAPIEASPEPSPEPAPAKE